MKDKEATYLSPLGHLRKVHICSISGQQYDNKIPYEEGLRDFLLQISKEEADEFRKNNPNCYFIHLAPSVIGSTYFLVDRTTKRFKNVTNYDAW